MPELPTSLESLVCKMEDRGGSASLDQLYSLLADTKVAEDDMEELLCFVSSRDAHGIIKSGERYLLAMMCLRSGQRSPIHSHVKSVCVFKVLRGICGETTYKVSSGGHVFPLLTQEHVTGTVVAKSEADIYQFSNLQNEGRNVLTLHIYVPPPTLFQMFSVADAMMADSSGGTLLRHWSADRKGLRRAAWSLSSVHLDNVVRLMRERMRHDLHIIDFSQLTGHSEAHFSVLFKNRTGESPYHYFKRLRMTEAKRLIMEGETDLEKVALAVGYSHIGQFGQTFRKFWGILPRDLRNQVQASKDCQC